VKINANLLTSKSVFLALFLIACANEQHSENASMSCEKLDLEAIRLAGHKKLQEAGAMFDRAIAQCPVDPSRINSRGVLYAAEGQPEKAEALINEAINLAEGLGDHCRADVFRADLNMVRGGPQLKALPESCRPSSVKSK
jgi:Tfp pilus assembly protein PilF